jgi:hypothetical protein
LRSNAREILCRGSDSQAAATARVTRQSAHAGRINGDFATSSVGHCERRRKARTSGATATRNPEENSTIRTNYSDRQVIHRNLDQLQDAPEDVKNLGVEMAAELFDLGITIIETRDESLEVRDRIPDNLLFQVAEVNGYEVFVHGHLDDLPATA